MESPKLKEGQQLGLVVCRHTKHFIVEAIKDNKHKKRKRFVCDARKHCQNLVTGDIVVWKNCTDQTGLIEGSLKRKNLLQRPDHYGKIKPIAANIDQMLIVIACKPEPQPILIDQYIVAANLLSIKPILILNKTDLIDSNNQKQTNSLLDIYENLKFPVYRIHCKQNQSPIPHSLVQAMQNNTNIIVGQSGVGKSSIIKQILPSINIKIGELSHHRNEGKHTTVHSELFHLHNQGALIDSPGIRNFGLWNINEIDLESGFIEIATTKQHCQFRNCKHTNEPKCAVKKAVKENTIHPQRFANFNKLKQTIMDKR